MKDYLEKVKSLEAQVGELVGRWGGLMLPTLLGLVGEEDREVVVQVFHLLPAPDRDYSPKMFSEAYRELLRREYPSMGERREILNPGKRPHDYPETVEEACAVLDWASQKACVELFQHITLTLSCLAKARELLAEGEGNSPRDRNLRLWDLEKALTEAQSVLSLARSRAELLPGLIRAEELLHCLFL